MLGRDLVKAGAVVGLGPVVVAVAAQVSAANPLEVESPSVLAVDVLPETALVAHYHLAQNQLLRFRWEDRAKHTYVVVGFSVAQSAAFASLSVLVDARLDVREHQLLPLFDLHARHWYLPSLSAGGRAGHGETRGRQTLDDANLGWKRCLDNGYDRRDLAAWGGRCDANWDALVLRLFGGDAAF